MNTVMAVATQMAVESTAWWAASGGARHSPMATSWRSVFTLAVLRAGMDTPWRPTTDR